jgi:hypothetical protein
MVLPFSHLFGDMRRLNIVDHHAIGKNGVSTKIRSIPCTCSQFFSPAVSTL